MNKISKVEWVVILVVPIVLVALGGGWLWSMFWMGVVALVVTVWNLRRGDR